MARFITRILSITAVYAAFAFVPTPAAEHPDSAAVLNAPASVSTTELA